MNEVPTISKGKRVLAIALIICLVAVIGVATYESVMGDREMATEGWLTALVLLGISLTLGGDYWKSVLKRNKDSKQLTNERYGPPVKAGKDFPV